MNARDLVNVGESALVLYDDGEVEIDDGTGVTGPLTVNIHLQVDKVIIFQQVADDEEDGVVYVADFVRFEETETEDGFRVRFADAEKLGAAGSGWFSFSGRSDTATYHLQPTP